MNILCPISIGELVDKLSILHIKLIKINDKKKLENIRHEFDALNKVFDIKLCADYYDELINVNDELWDVLGVQRVLEKENILSQKFIDVSIDVYRLNDKRFFIKDKINKEFSSDIIEEKHYEGYEGYE